MGEWAWWIYEVHPLPFVLLAFLVADIISGILVSIDRKELASDVQCRGINQQMGMMLIVVMCYAAQRVFPEIPLGAIACCLYISKEGLSLVENVVLLGVPVPEELVSVLEKVHRKNTSPKRAREEIRLQSAEIKTDSLVVRSRDTDTTDTITEGDDRESIL